MSICDIKYFNYIMNLLNDVSDPCHEHNVIQDSSRSVTNRNFLSVRCDQDELATSWFRFKNSNISDVALSTRCTPLARCQTMSTGWMNGSHPIGMCCIFDIMYNKEL